MQERYKYKDICETKRLAKYATTEITRQTCACMQKRRNRPIYDVCSSVPYYRFFLSFLLVCRAILCSARVANKHLIFRTNPSQSKTLLYERLASPIQTRRLSTVILNLSSKQHIHIAFFFFTFSTADYITTPTADSENIGGGAVVAMFNAMED